MPTWTQKDIHKDMHVFSSDQTDLGSVKEVYEDSFMIHKGLLSKHRYLPYNAITSIEQHRVQLNMSDEDVSQPEWEKRPDFEHHLGDPTQLFYDRGHGVSDPFDETNPTKS